MLGLGLVLIAVGAVFTWVVDEDVPYVDEQGLGPILLVLGVVVMLAALVIRAYRSHSLGDADTGLLVFGAGAVLTWALEVDIPYIWDAALGAIMMIGGLVAVAAAVFTESQKTRTKRVVIQR